MILMNQFGIPNTGAQLCGTNKTDPTIEKLCARYFSLSLISPIAFYRDKNNQSTEGHPFNFTDAKVKQTIADTLKTRQNLILYQREQLRHIEIFGGALIKPAFTEFESLNKENLADLDLQTVTFGNAILASF
jgi:alpha-glucosidase (family GH31 glycosyl hydrolase)